MREHECWQEITNLEAQMKAMHETLDKIVDGSSGAPEIVAKALKMQRDLHVAFASKFDLVGAIKRFFA